MRLADLQRRFRPKTTGRRRSSRATRVGVWTAVAVAGLLALAADSAPTGTEWVDAAWRFIAAAGLAYATSYARRWSWVYLALLTSAVALSEPLLLALALVSMVIAIVGYAAMDRERAMGALVGGACAQVLLRLPDFGFLGSSAMVALAICVPVIVSAWFAAPRRVKYKVAGISGIALVLGAFVSAGAGFGAAQARSSVELGMEYAEAGVEAMLDGEQDEAEDHLNRAAEEFKKANDAVSAPWAVGGRLVPVVGHQSKAVMDLTDAALEVTETASGASQMIDIDALRLEAGRVNTGLVVAMDEPLGDLVSSLDSASAAIEDVNSPWLLTPLADRLDRAATEIDDVLPTAHDLADTLEVAPALLGVDEPKTYLVLFVTPSELRGLGGFIGAFAEVQMDDGSLSLIRTGRPTELNAVLRSEVAELDGPQEYLDRWGRYQPQFFFQDITFSPDFPAVADVAAQLYPQAGGSEVDGVISLDPAVLAALLEFTGPVEVGNTRLTPENAEEYLLFDQYVDFESDDPDRKDQLDEALREVFDRLVRADVPSPRLVKEVLGPLVDEDRLNLQSSDGDVQDLYSRFGMAGEAQRADGSDFVSVISQNAVNNKIDYFLEREIRYDVDFNPATGDVDAELALELTNNAPPEGLPLSIIGANDRAIPTGTNWVNVSIITPHRLQVATLSGEPITLVRNSEFGFNSYELIVIVPPESSRTLTLQLIGRVDPGTEYALGVSPQPVVNTDRYRVRVTPQDAWELGKSEDFEADNGSWVLNETPKTDVVYTGTFR